MAAARLPGVVVEGIERHLIQLQINVRAARGVRADASSQSRESNASHGFQSFTDAESKPLVFALARAQFN